MATRKASRKRKTTGKAKTAARVKATAGKRASPKRAPARTARPRRPAVSAINEVVHWEIQSQQPERLHRFYADALGWKIDTDNPMGYGMVDSAGKSGIRGGIGGSEGSESRVVVYASVKDIPAALERIEAHGGKAVMPRTDIGPVIMALYQDPEGNTMGLLEG